MKNPHKIFYVTILLILLSTSIIAQEHKYSYEKAESLKPLVEWRDYGPDAFNEAMNENKPIFLLLTAPSWCYWCQVYESEDYLFHPNMVEFLNKNTIPIYVDADQRQDLTRQYLEGGWPSTTVLTPSRVRLYGYSGPRPVGDMVTNLQKAVDHVNSQGLSNSIEYNYEPQSQKIPTEIELNNLVNWYKNNFESIYDKTNGGFGSGQKFPQGRTLDYSLDLYEQTNEIKWLELVQNTLKNQYTNLSEIETNYNLYDPVEGGFHRYGTSVVWSPPHYEKMLYDNARLLKTYFHLQQITPDDELVKEVVDMTLEYIDINWYDNELGGFYGNTDVHGEDAYYGKSSRSVPKARVEKTKYTDWNSEAIITYAYLYEKSRDEEYKTIVEKSLNYISDEIITDVGAYHYLSIDGKKEVRGSLTDNSLLILAFIEGYETLGENEYKETAIELADYSLNNLYDWNSGGFFERNSPDTDLYAPRDNVLLTKPAQENGIISYALFRLYIITNDEKYLNAGLKSLGITMNSISNLDRSYYHAKSAQFVLDNNLLENYSQIESGFFEYEKQQQQEFWLKDLLNDNNAKNEETKFTTESSESKELDSPFIFLLLIALVSGLISFLSPCTLPILPAYIAYTFKSSKKNIVGMTLAFFVGLSITFTLLGMSATILGNFLKSNLNLFTQISGLVIIIFGIYTLFGKGFSGVKINQKNPTNYISSFLFGLALGVSWTPCIGPILVSVLVLASNANSVIFGGLLLFTYALGLSLPLIIVSKFLSKIKNKKIWNFLKGKELSIFGYKIHTSTLISGILFLILGYLMFSGQLFVFNKFVVSSNLQILVFNLEGYLLNLI